MVTAIATLLFKQCRVVMGVVRPKIEGGKFNGIEGSCVVKGANSHQRLSRGFGPNLPWNFRSASSQC